MSDDAFPTPALIDYEAQELAAVRARVALDEIPALFDRAYPAIFAAIGRAGAQIAGAPMGVTRGEPGETLDLAAAVPVAEPFAADGEVLPERIPAGRVATLLVTGDYAQLADAYGHLFGWIAQQGLVPAGISWEQYLTEPEPGGDPALNETLLCALIDTP